NVSDHLIVAVVAVISGGFAIPVGFLLDLPPLETYLAATVGALAGMAFFIFVGASLRDWIVKKANISEDKMKQGQQMLGKYGVRGLGLVGPIFPGVTVSVLIGLAAGIDRKQLATWMSIGVVAMYAIYTIGLAVIIEIAGI
ncbi:MAG: small multi-drug export protein, partial [Actinomycetia bacterium]|nr:small multi-drug export protein [Actinomycetes bacterium]